MAGALGPAVCGTNPNAGRRVAFAHLGGLLFGAAVIALLLALVGQGLRTVDATPVATTVVVAGLLLTAAQVGGAGPLSSRWQVPERWRRQLEPVSLAALYGALLGTGFLTSVVSSAFWLFVGMSLIASPTVALVAWTAYASSRWIGFMRSATPTGEPRLRLTLSWQRANPILALAVSLAALALVWVG